MRKQAARRHLVSWPLSAAILLAASQAHAQQEAFPAPSPLTVKLEDENGVDVLSGEIHFRIPDVSIGDLGHVKTVLSYDSSTQPQPYANPPDRDSFLGGLVYSENRDFSQTTPIWVPRPTYQVKVAGIAGTFHINSDYSLQSYEGNTLTGTGVNSWVAATSTSRDHPLILNGGSLGIWVFTARDGTQVDIDTAKKPMIGFTGYLGAATKITYPSGRIVRINYRSDCSGAPRIQSVTSNNGVMLKYLYDDSGCTAKQTGVIAINTAFEYCDPMADTCTVDPKWRRSQYSSSLVNGKVVYDVTDQSGASSKFTLDRWGRVASYRPPGSTEDRMSFKYCLSYWTYTNSGSPPTLDPAGSDPDEVFCGEKSDPYAPWWNYIFNRVVGVSRSGLWWSYGLPVLLAPGSSPYPRQYQIFRPVGPTTYVNIDTHPGGGMTGFIDPSQAIVAYDTASQRITHAQMRNQPDMVFSYDSRGNILSNGVTTAGYDATCANIVKCNKPNWTHDVGGNQADFTYDSTHGGVLTETLPAVGGVRPQKRYTYVQRYAWFLNSSGTMTRSTEPIWLLATESYCRTGSASGAGCAIAGDEVVTTYDYGPDSGPNNLWLRGTVVTADGQSLRTCYAYSKFGDKISETKPRAGLTVCP